jgi:hypothetical protein
MKYSKYTSLIFTPNKVTPPYSAWIEHIPFAFFLIEILHPKIFVELGVHTGNSYNAFCQSVKSLQTNTKCYGVDTWQGDEHAGFYDKSVYDNLQVYQQHEYSAFSTLIKSTFDEALECFSEGSVDLLHIDGFHTYEAVKHDFDNWLPKMSEQGVIIFHDTNVHANGFGVWKLWQEISPNYLSMEFKNCHGLGILVIGKKTEHDFIEFVKEENNYSSYIFQILGNSLSQQLDLKQSIKDLKSQQNDQIKLESINSELMAKNESINSELKWIKNSKWWKFRSIVKKII